MATATAIPAAVDGSMSSLCSVRWSNISIESPQILYPNQATIQKHVVEDDDDDDDDNDDDPIFIMLMSKASHLVKMTHNAESVATSSTMLRVTGPEPWTRRQHIKSYHRAKARYPATFARAWNSGDL